MARTGVNIAEKASMIWSCADMLRGLYKPHQYGNVILPMTVIKRFHDYLLPTRDKVLETYEKVKQFEVKDGFLTTASGYAFYNISSFTFDSLLADPENIESNFRTYLAGFSDNVLDILENFKFDDEIKTMADNDMLFYIIQEFNSQKSYMNPDKVTAVDMGYIYRIPTSACPQGTATWSVRCMRRLQQRQRSMIRFFPSRTLPVTVTNFKYHALSDVPGIYFSIRHNNFPADL